MFFDKFFKSSKKVFPYEKVKSTVREHTNLSGDMGKNIEEIKKSIGSPADLVIRTVKDGNKPVMVLLWLATLVVKTGETRHAS